MKKIQKRDIVLFCVIVVVAILTKIFQYNFLPEKYFYDSEYLLNMVNYQNFSSGDSFAIIARFYDFINIFKFNTLLQWSVGIAIVYNLVIFIICSYTTRKEKLTICDYCFLVASIVLLNIFVFNISKEAIQITIFILMLLIIKNHQITDRKKILVTAIIFAIESIFFRIYYIIIAGLIVVIYFLLEKNIEKEGKRNILYILGIMLLIICIGLLAAKIIVPSQYEQVINVRSALNAEREGASNAKTMIADLIEHNGNLVLFMVNYIINGIRMMIPIELIFKGYKYLPFVIYQLYVTYNMLKSIRNLNKDNLVICVILISFFFGSFIFEPDFGSFVRHESALFLLIFEMIRNTRNNYKMIEKGTAENEEKYQGL